LVKSTGVMQVIGMLLTPAENFTLSRDTLSYHLVWSPRIFTEVREERTSIISHLVGVVQVFKEFLGSFSHPPVSAKDSEKSCVFPLKAKELSILRTSLIPELVAHVLHSSSTRFISVLRLLALLKSPELEERWNDSVPL